MCQKIVTGLLAAAAFAGCTESGRLPVAPSAEAWDDPTVSFATGTQGVPAQVYVFRQEEGAFRFDTLLQRGWTDDGRLEAKLPRGEYRFLFAAYSGGQGLTAEPLLPGDEVGRFAFRAVEGPEQGYVLPAEELYLQSSRASDSVYRVGVGKTSVRASMTRAVGRIVVLLKRGYFDGVGYVPVPYGQGESILNTFASVDLDISGVGTGVSPWGSSGEARMRASLRADSAGVSPEGFARLDGPFVIPPAQGDSLSVSVALNPHDNTLPASTAKVRGALARNERLEITLWLNRAEPVVDVTVRTEAMTAESEGDSGIWE